MKRRPNLLKRRSEGIMDNYSTEQFQYSKANIINYGQLFINSEGGQNWEKLWKGSSRSPIEPFWLHFYYNLETNKFQDSIESLFRYKIGAYRREKIIQETKDLIEKIKVTETINPENPALKTCVSIGPETLVKFKEKIEFLFENYILENYPLGEGDISDRVILKLVNGKFKEILLDGYYSIINHYENEDHQKIQKLKKKVKDLDNVIQSQSNEHWEKLAQLNNKIATLDVTLKILENENQELIRNNQRSDEKKESEEKETPDSIAFILTFLYRLGVLDNYIWPEEKTDLQIAALLTDLLTLRGREEINIEAFSRDRKRIINQEERGQNILAKHDTDAKQAITKRFPKFDFEQQEFLLKFKSKAK